MHAFFFARPRVLMCFIAVLPLVGCLSPSRSGLPVEQLTVRFNADLTQHWGEYRLIRPQLTQNQCIWQLYTDGQLVQQGQIPLPRQGLGSLFAEMNQSAVLAAATTSPAVGENDLDEQIYVIHLTYETPDGRRQVESSGSMTHVARALAECPQIYAMHQRIMRKLPQSYWFAHLDPKRDLEWSPSDSAHAEAR